MQTYEFFTKITPDGTLVLPVDVAKHISHQKQVRVVLMIEQEHNGTEENLLSLEQLIHEIKNTTPKSENIQPASGLLFEYLAHPLTEPTSDFDAERWNVAWDELERSMDENELTQETNL